MFNIASTPTPQKIKTLHLEGPSVGQVQTPAPPEAHTASYTDPYFGSVTSAFSEGVLIYILLHTWSFSQVTIIPLVGSYGHYFNTWKTETENLNASLFITIKSSST